MERIIMSIEEKYLLSSLELVEEIRSKKYYVPELELSFQASYRFGIEAGPNITLPHPDCLMGKELDKNPDDANHKKMYRVINIKQPFHAFPFSTLPVIRA